MPNIPFPDIPPYPGVPALPRAVVSAVASVPLLAISLGALEGILGSALQQPARWGIFDSNGNQLGTNLKLQSTSQRVKSALLDQLTGASSPILSTLEFDFVRETRISDFPIERGSFASFNKVQIPANPIVILALSGSESDRIDFLNAIDAASTSTELYSVITPEVQYVNYSIERYIYERRADKGATLLVVEISLKEIRQVSAAFTQSGNKPITSPKNPGATTQTNNGMTQPATPPQSTLLSLAKKLGLSN